MSGNILPIIIGNILPTNKKSLIRKRFNAFMRVWQEANRKGTRPLTPIHGINYAFNKNTNGKTKETIRNTYRLTREWKSSKIITIEYGWVWISKNKTLEQ